MGEGDVNVGTELLWVLICGLALYGLILISWQLARLLCNHTPASPYLSLLFVVRDQAAIMEGLVREILAIYQTSLPPFDLVIVDDSSSDETSEILRRLNKNNAFTFIENSLDDQSLELGLHACRGQVISYFNLTGQVNPRLVGRLARRLLQGDGIMAPLEHCALTLVHRKK
jgi:hypothetical protein